MNIVTIGGGERTKALSYALDMTGHEYPSVLIVPTACSTVHSYNKNVPGAIKRFEELGVQNITTLHEFEKYPTPTQLTHELGRTSLIYTLGGNTPYLLKQLEDNKSASAIRETIHSGTVHAGTSAGGLLPFGLIHSCIARRPAEEIWNYQILGGLGAVNAVATAHADQHDQTPNGQRPDSRLDHLINHFPESVSTGYGIDNNAALIFTNQQTFVIRENPDANAHVIHEAEGNISIETL